MMQLLVQFLRGFSYFAGITPPKPQDERKTAVALLLALLVIAMLLAAFLFYLIPAMFRATPG